jgi:hypothetical protein
MAEDSSMVIERSKIDVEFENSGDEPFGDFVGILRGMQEAGLVNGVENYLKRYAVWASRLSPEEADHLAETKRRLLPLSEIERTHGCGAALDLSHPLVHDLREWGKLDEAMIANATAFRDRELSS